MLLELRDRECLRAKEINTPREQAAPSKLVSHFSHTEGSMRHAPEAQAPWLWFSKMLSCAMHIPRQCIPGGGTWQGPGGGGAGPYLVRAMTLFFLGCWLTGLPMLPFFREPFRASSRCFSAGEHGKEAVSCLQGHPALPLRTAWAGLHGETPCFSKN